MVAPADLDVLLALIAREAAVVLIRLLLSLRALSDALLAFEFGAFLICSFLEALISSSGLRGVLLRLRPFAEASEWTCHDCFLFIEGGAVELCLLGLCFMDLAILRLQHLELLRQHINEHRLTLHFQLVVHVILFGLVEDIRGYALQVGQRGLDLIAADEWLWLRLRLCGLGDCGAIRVRALWLRVLCATDSRPSSRFRLLSGVDQVDLAASVFEHFRFHSRFGKGFQAYGTITRLTCRVPVPSPAISLLLDLPKILHLFDQLLIDCIQLPHLLFNIVILAFQLFLRLLFHLKGVQSLLFQQLETFYLRSFLEADRAFVLLQRILQLPNLQLHHLVLLVFPLHLTLLLLHHGLELLIRYVQICVLLLDVLLKLLLDLLYLSKHGFVIHHQVVERLLHLLLLSACFVLHPLHLVCLHLQPLEQLVVVLC